MISLQAQWKATISKALLICPRNIQKLIRGLPFPTLHFKWLISMFDWLFDRLLRLLSSWNTLWTNDVTSECAVSAFDLFSSDETLRFYEYVIFFMSHPLWESRECVSPSPPLPLLHSSVFAQKPAGRWFRFPGLLLWMWKHKWVFDVLSVFHFCCPLWIYFTKTAATLGHCEALALFIRGTQSAQSGSCFSDYPTWLPTAALNSSLHVHTDKETQVYWRKVFICSAFTFR